MVTQPTFLAADAHRYVDNHLPDPGTLVQQVGEMARAEGQPAVSAQTGAVLATLVAASGGTRILEVGCNLGYSALWMARGLAAEGRIDTIEIDPGLAARARRHFSDAGLGARVTVHEGAALDVLPRLAGGYDLVFLDAVKSEYEAYLEHVQERLLRPGGIIAADNVFWQGRAWDHEAVDEDTKGLRAYVDRVRGAPWVTSILAVGDGLAVSVLAGGQ